MDLVNEDKFNRIIRNQCPIDNFDQPDYEVSAKQMIIKKEDIKHIFATQNSTTSLSTTAKNGPLSDRTNKTGKKDIKSPKDLI